MGCKASVEAASAGRAVSPEEKAEQKEKATQLLVHHVARRPPQPWEEELCTEMMDLLGKTSAPMKLNPRDVRRFALQFCYGNLHDTSEEQVSRCIRRALQINRAMQAQGFRYFRVVLAEQVQGSMTGSVLKGLVLRTAEDVGYERVKATPLTNGFSGRAIVDAAGEDDEDDMDLEDVVDVTDSLDTVF